MPQEFKGYVYPVADSTALIEQRKLMEDAARSSRNPSTLVRLNYAGFDYPVELIEKGGTKVPSSYLKFLRNIFMEEWERAQKVECKRPDTDAHMATVLYENLKMHPEQVSDRNVWDTLAEFVFPDYVFERWGDNGNTGRFKPRDSRRNALRRLWLRRRTFTRAQESMLQDCLDQAFLQELYERLDLIKYRHLVDIFLLVMAEVSAEFVISREYHREIFKVVNSFKDNSLNEISDPDDIYPALRVELFRLARELNLPRTEIH